MHSIYSDGIGTVDHLTQTAEKLNLDFIVLTDHGRPNVKSATATSWQNKVLLIGGSELSLNCGHMACMGFKKPGYIFPPEPQEAIDEIMADNEQGVCFVSHPFDDRIPWTDWDINAFTGLEVYSSYTEARRADLLKLVFFPLKYVIDSDFALLDTMKYPANNMDMWDELNRRTGLNRRYYGIYSLDAHGKLPVTKTFNLKFPSYESMFRVMTVYVKTDEALKADAYEAENQVVSAIKKGRFFNVLEAIAPANGFDALFQEQETGNRIQMGGASDVSKGKILLSIPWDFLTSITLFKDGAVFKEIQNKGKDRLEFDVDKPGVYRLELKVPESRFKDLPWLVTNPFFIGLNAQVDDLHPYSQDTESGFQGQPFPVSIQQFKIEKNNGSKAALNLETETDGSVTLTFLFKLNKDNPESRDFWSMLALRQQLDLSAYQGISLKIQSQKQLRYWIELRTDSLSLGSETWYRHSFLAKPGWRRIKIPFNKFQSYFGNKKDLDLTRIQAMFIGINNQSAYVGTECQLQIKELALF